MTISVRLRNVLTVRNMYVLYVYADMERRYIVLIVVQTFNLMFNGQRKYRFGLFRNVVYQA